MACKKQGVFDTEDKAKTVMRKVKIKLTGQVPFRTWYCTEHKGWHYSSTMGKRRRP